MDEEQQAGMTLREATEQILQEMMAAGHLESSVKDGVMYHRLTAAGHAEGVRAERRKAQELVDDCVAVGFLEPAGRDHGGRRQWLITEAGEFELLTDEERAQDKEWYFVERPELH